MLPKVPRRPSHKITFDEATKIWLLRINGHFANRIANQFDCNPARIYDVLSEKLHRGSRDVAIMNLEKNNPELAERLRNFKHTPKTHNGDDQGDLFVPPP